MLLLIFSLLAFNIVRGYCEGMVYGYNIYIGKPVAFYHRLRLLEISLLSLCAIACYKLQFVPISVSGLCFISGAIILSWQGFEMAYSYSRYRLLVPDRENVLGLDRILIGFYVTFTHILRLIISITLLIIGGLL